MALVLKDRVQETTAVTGDSPAVLLGAIAGYQTFANSTPNASVVYYTIAGGTEWEVGYGTYYTNNNSVVRVTSQVYSSSNAGAIVDFSAGTKNIFVTMPAEQAVYQEVDGSLKLIGGIIEVSLDGTESANALPNVAFQAFSTIDSYMQSNMQNLDSGNFASADYVVTADDGTDTDNYLDMGMGSSGYNYPEYSGTGPHDGYLMNTGRNLVLLSGKYGANVTAANASSTDIVFVAGDLLADGERARIKGSTGNIILSNTSNPTDDGSKLQVAGNVTITGNTAVSGAVFSNAAISSNNQLATKSYVDTAVSTGLHIHEPVRLAQGTNLTATYNNGSSGVGANLTNSGSQIALVIDTITANVSDRVLVYGQSNAVQNGVYVVSNTGSNSTNWVLTRSSDADTYTPQSDTGLGGGDYFYVQEGATQAGDSYVCTNTGNITFGVTNITFTQFSGAITYVGASPINVSGQTISLSGVVDATHGGTGLSTYNTGDMIYANGANSLTNLTVGSSGQTLIVSGGAPAWGALDMAGSGVSGTLPAVHGGTGYASYTIGEILYSNSSTTLAKVIPNNTTTQKVLTQTGNGTTVTSTAWNQLSSGDITGLGTMATQNASSVAITGGSVNGTLIGNATPSSGAFTTLSASSNVSGTGFANYLNAPPSIGGVTPNTGAFTTLSATGLITGSANVNIDAGTFFVDSTNNRVGIGTSSPVSPLTVNTNITSNDGGYLKSIYYSGGWKYSANSSGLGFAIAADGNGVYLSTAPASGTVDGAATVTERMRIDSSGNVGIGTTSPSGKLDVVGDVIQQTYLTSAASYLFIAKKARGTISAPTVIVNGDTVGGLISGGYDGSAYRYTAALEFVADGAVSASNVPMAVKFSTGTTTSYTERMRITSAGNVGIGTSSPTFGSGGGLQVKNASDSSVRITSGSFTGFDIQQSSTGIAYLYNRDNTAMIFGTNNTNRMTLDASGNLGIGTSPSYKLDVRQTTDGTYAYFRRIGGTINPGIKVVVNETGNTVGFDTDYSTSSPAYTFSIGGTEKMRITSAGKVGIGNSSPIATLDVVSGSGTYNGGIRINNGTSNSGTSGQYIVGCQSSAHYNWLMGSQYNVGNAFEITPSTAANGTTFSTPAVVVLSNGNVGIGTTAPAAPLDVAGASNATVTARVYNANTNSATSTALMLNAGGRYVQQTVNYGSSYYYISSVNIPTWYSNFDTYNFRNTGSAVQVAISSTASANNYVNLTGGLGVGPTISAQGNDTNIDLKITPKGSGYANITSGGIKFPDATVQTTAAGAVAGNSSIIINNVNITSNATIAAGQNGFSVGPITTANGVSVTVASGQQWVVI